MGPCSNWTWETRDLVVFADLFETFRNSSAPSQGFGLPHYIIGTNAKWAAWTSGSLPNPSLAVEPSNPRTLHPFPHSSYFCHERTALNIEQTNGENRSERNLKIDWSCSKYIVSKDTQHPGSIIVASCSHSPCFAKKTLSVSMFDAPWTIWPPHILWRRRVVHRLGYAWRPARAVKMSGQKSALQQVGLT